MIAIIRGVRTVRHDAVEGTLLEAYEELGGTLFSFLARALLDTLFV